jgi:hypothetical protein
MNVHGITLSFPKGLQVVGLGGNEVYLFKELLPMDSICSIPSPSLQASLYYPM